MLKMSEKSIFAVLLRSPWWYSYLVAAVLGLVATALLPDDFSVVGPLCGFPFLVVGTMAAWRQRSAPKPALVEQTLQRCASMSWTEFSAWVESVYLQQGYVVNRLDGSGGVDFLLERNGDKTVLSCKRWKAASHGAAVLTDLLAQRQVHKAQHCIYLSLSPVSEAAVRLAQEQGVLLVSGKELAVLFCKFG